MIATVINLTDHRNRVLQQRRLHNLMRPALFICLMWAVWWTLVFQREND